MRSWVFDHTLRRRLTDGYVRVGHGRDYGDVAPLRGTYSGGRSEMFVTVEMTGARLAAARDWAADVSGRYLGGMSNYGQQPPYGQNPANPYGQPQPGQYGSRSSRGRAAVRRTPTSAAVSGPAGPYPQQPGRIPRRSSRTVSLARAVRAATDAVDPQPPATRGSPLSSSARCQS